MYTVRQFRASLKKALDDAKYHPVAITRNGKTYLLVCKDSAYMAKKKVVEEETSNPRAIPFDKPTAYFRVGEKRTKHTILDEINNTEAQQKEELEFCQDAEEGREIRRRYKQQIDALWAEYREAV
jgi:hypothetical protein